MPQPTYGNPSDMEAEGPREPMTADEIIAAMLNAQRDTAHQIATLQRDQVAQQRQFTQMLQTLANAIQNQPVPIVNLSQNTNPAPAKPNIPLPDAFNGARLNAEPFLSGLHLVFQGTPTHYTTDDAKIALALSLMQAGTAGP